MEVFATYSSPIGRLADEILALPAGLQRRAVVLTSSERLAHAIRREVAVVRNCPAGLAGIVFRRPIDLACDILARHGRPYVRGWESIRQARVLQVLQAGDFAAGLEYFEPSRLRSGQGYSEALTDAIHDLEAAGFDPDSLVHVAADVTDDPRAAGRLRDLATVWRAADAGAGDWRTSSAILLEAARQIDAAKSSTRDVPVEPRGRLPEKGQLSFEQLVAADGATRRGAPAEPPLPALPPIFAALTASPTAALVAFLESLQDVRVVLQDARPVRTGTHRWRTRMGVAAPQDAVSEGSEVALVQRYLFELPEHLSDPGRPRSRGVDGTVDIEEHAGIEDEVEAAAQWVAERIVAGTPLERIAVVVPERGSYARLLVDRFARLAGSDAVGAVEAYVAGGLPLADSAAGRRMLLLLAALMRDLEVDATLRLLPALRRSGQAADAPATRLSPSRAAEIVFEAGIAGGGAGDLDTMRQWTPKLEAHRRRLGAAIAAAEAAPDDRNAKIAAASAHRWLRDVEPILEAVASLQTLAEDVAAQSPLRALWPKIAAFCRRHLLLPPDPPAFVEQFERTLTVALDDTVVGELAAGLALRWLVQRLQREHRPVGRYGEARVFVGTPVQAAGLTFDDVRIVGLTEGGLPRTPHDDPVIPDDLRRRMDASAGHGVPRLADRVLDDLHGVFRVVRGASSHLALSVPRQWVDRSEREVSGVVLEVATALARPSADGAGGDVPTAGKLRTTYFAEGAAARARGRRACGASERALQFLVAAPGGENLPVPVQWMAPGPRDLGRLGALRAAAEASHYAPVDGVVGPMVRRLQDLGSEGRPISASALQVLLGCPHRFLLERVLHWREPPQRPTTDTIEPITYGNLFHSICETLLREVGPQLCRKDGSIEWWMRRAEAIADEALDRLLERYPLRGSEARTRERERLVAQLASFVRDEWDRPAREFVAAELPFGPPQPIALPAGERPMFLRGAIDRVDRLADGTLSVRDIKTGRVRDLAEEEVNAVRDVQIGVYAAVVEAMQGETARVSEAAYVHPSAAREPERAFRGAQLEGLAKHTRTWLRVGEMLLERGAFVRTPDVEDCRNCPFVPHCGAGAQARSERKLTALPQADALGAFLAMKRERKFDE